MTIVQILKVALMMIAMCGCEDDIKAKSETSKDKAIMAGTIPGVKQNDKQKKPSEENSSHKILVKCEQRFIGDFKKADKRLDSSLTVLKEGKKATNLEEYEHGCQILADAFGDYYAELARINTTGISEDTRICYGQFREAISNVHECCKMRLRLIEAAEKLSESEDEHAVDAFLSLLGAVLVDASGGDARPLAARALGSGLEGISESINTTEKLKAAEERLEKKFKYYMERVEKKSNEIKELVSSHAKASE